MSILEKSAPNVPACCSAIWSAALGSVLLLAFIPLCAHAQPERRPLAASLSEQRVAQALAWMVAHAPVILSGEVLAACGDDVAGEPIVFVNIRVGHAFRGVQPGETFRLGQWRGAEKSQLMPHDRVVLFLHGPNGAGLSSIVSGGLGLLRLGGGEQVDVRALEMFSAQREPKPGVPQSTNTALRSAGLRSRMRNPITPGPRRPLNIPESPNSLPAREVFAMIDAQVRAQAAGRMEASQKEAVDVR